MPKSIGQKQIDGQAGVMRGCHPCHKLKITTMKSKRAKRIIAVNARDQRDEAIATKAVELAEDDARERAVQTFCTLQRLDCEAYCTPCAGAECFGRNEFLKHYDNES